MIKLLTLDQYLERKSITLKQIEKSLLSHLDEGTLLGIYITGSVAEDHGTASSDLDINVVLSDGSSIVSEVRNIYVHGIRIDIEYISVSLLDDLNKFLDSFDFNSTEQYYFNCDISKGVSNSFIIDAVGRILNGRVIQQSQDVRFKLGQVLDNGLFDYLSNLKRLLSENNYEDVVGFYEEGDFTSAYLQSLNLINHVYMTKLLDKKIYIDRVKWVPFWLRVSLPEDYEIYAQLLDMAASRKSVEFALDLADRNLEHSNDIC